MDNGDPRFPSSRYLRVPFIFVPEGSPPPLEWIREHPQYLTISGFYTPSPPSETDTALEPQPGAEGQAEASPEKPVYLVDIGSAGRWAIARRVSPLTPQPAPWTEPQPEADGQAEPQPEEPIYEEPAPEPEVEAAAAAAHARDRPAWQRIVPPPGPLIYPPARERPPWQRCVPPPGPRRAPDGPPPLGPNPAVYAFDPLSPEFATDLVRKTARIVEGMDWVMRPGGIATPEGLSAAVRAGMQHLAAHQGDVRAALASVKAAGATADDDNLAPPAARPPWPDPMWREGLPGEVSTPTATAGHLEYDLLDPGGLFLNNRHGGNEGLSPGVQLAAFYVVSPPTERSHDPYVIPAAGTKNPLEPIPGAVGPHSTFRRAPDGPIHHYETYEENPKTGTFERVLRYRGTGKEHGKVRTPYVMEPSPGKGPGSPPKVARPALPHEIPGTVTPAPTQASPPPQQAVPPTTSPPESTPTGPDVPETDIPDGVML